MSDVGILLTLHSCMFAHIHAEMQNHAYIFSVQLWNIKADSLFLVTTMGTINAYGLPPLGCFPIPRSQSGLAFSETRRPCPTYT